jgi:spermidine synthase
MPRHWLLTIFFVSGACGLIYEVVWMRVLTLTLSVTVYAVTTVLCAYMAGLALGAAIAGRYADRLQRPLAAFGLAEIGIGIAGVIVPPILFGLGPVEISLHAALGGGLAYNAARFGLAAAILILPCTLMGTTLPLLSRATVESRDDVARGTGGLYAFNSLGAVAGCLVAGFYLIPALGLTTASLTAAALNISLGSLALGVAWRQAPRAVPSAAPDGGAPGARVGLAAIAFGISGFTALGLEVLWTRALEQFTHNSTYAYTSMLAVFLLGIGGGSAISSRLADRVRRPLLAFGIIQLAIAVSVVCSLLLYMNFLDWIPIIASAVGGIASWPRAVALIFGIAMTAMLVTTLLFGATFPFMARAVVESMDHVARRIAMAYTVNTVGAILGAVVVGFVMLPGLGLRGSFVALVLTSLALGLVLVLRTAPRYSLAATAVALATAASAFLLLPPDLFRSIYEERYHKLLMYREQITDIVMVTEDEKGGRMIRYGDGRGTAGTETYREDRSYAHVALMPHPDPKRILNICFGVGNSLSSVAQYPVEHIHQVELSPGVIDAAPYFARSNRKVLSDPRVELTIADGRNFLLTSQERYDIIRLDPPELHTRGIVNLYTQEFFELARDHLAEGGIFSIWVNIAYTPEAEMRMIARTMREVFPHVTIWQSPWLYSWVFNGSVAPRPPDMALLTERFADPRLARDLASIPFEDPFDFLNYFVMADAEVDAFAGDAPVVTDDRTYLDFTVPRSVESFYGISNNITDLFLVDQIDPEADIFMRGYRYCRFKQPVFPHLVNAEASGMSAEQVAAELESRLGSQLGPEGCVGDAQAAAINRP